MANRLSPTRINRHYALGPIYYYDNVSEDDLRRAGVQEMPGQAKGSTINVEGATIRRLKCGRLNVTVWPGSRLLPDHAFSDFMASTLSPVELDDSETGPIPLAGPG